MGLKAILKGLLSGQLPKWSRCWLLIPALSLGDVKGASISSSVKHALKLLDKRWGLAQGA